MSIPAHDSFFRIGFSGNAKAGPSIMPWKGMPPHKPSAVSWSA